MKKVWFYRKGEIKEGPFTHEEIQHFLDRQELEETTRVWTESIGEWVPIGSLEYFQLNALDPTPSVAIEKAIKYERETDVAFSKPKIWIRLYARIIDYFLFASCLDLLLWKLIGMHLLLLFFFLPMILPFLSFCWVFVEAALLCKWGTTPGKWLLKTKVRTEQLQKMSFLDAMNRSLSVWWIGFGAGIPIVSFITMIVAATKLSSTGTTSWDRRNHYVVLHEKVGFGRIFAILLFLVGVYLFVGTSQVMQR